MTGVRGLAHANIRAPEAVIQRLRRFYIDVVGLREGPRPAFRSHGHWLYAGETDVLHLTVAAPGDAAPAPTGHFNHLAFACTDLAAARARMDAAGLAYEIDEVPELGQVQLFLTDPCGLDIELNFSR
ncbi:VOC family protein [Frateuria hangzhouensis]|uniref:VOC family protein n=1 Tax=Frateuria hangzhouensis TaxID=2995589 RepID=UPI002260878A|nr:VOC family protein [Frateuria sp. STR12]MCX7513649.1 VOC family protein [Frateuria sp. STR12]